MARVVVTVSIGYTNNRAIERIVGISQRLDEGFAMEQRKAGVAITGEPFAQTLGHFFPLTPFAALIVDACLWFAKQGQ